MAATSEGRLGGEDGYGEQLLSADQRAAADSMIREACEDLGWPALAERLFLPHRSGFIIYHVPGIAARALGHEPSAAAGAVMHVLTASFKMIDWLLDEEDWPEKETEGDPTPFERTLRHLVAPGLFLLEEATGKTADHYLTMDIAAFLERGGALEMNRRG